MPHGDVRKDINTINFEVKLLMLIGELIKICDDKERLESAKSAKENMLAYVDSFRHGRNRKATHMLHEFSTLHKREDLNKKSLKEGSRTTFQLQGSSPDVGYSPFEQAQDWKALNRFTIAKKARVFDRTAMVIGLAGTPKHVEGLIDLKCDEPTLKQDITDSTSVIRNSWQIRSY